MVFIFCWHSLYMFLLLLLIFEACFSIIHGDKGDMFLLKLTFNIRHIIREKQLAIVCTCFTLPGDFQVPARGVLPISYPQKY